MKPLRAQRHRLRVMRPNLTEADQAYYSDALLAQAQRREQRVQIDYSPHASAGRGHTIG